MPIIAQSAQSKLLNCSIAYLAYLNGWPKAGSVLVVGSGSRFIAHCRRRFDAVSILAIPAIPAGIPASLP